MTTRFRVFIEHPSYEHKRGLGFEVSVATPLWFIIVSFGNGFLSSNIRRTGMLTGWSRVTDFSYFNSVNMYGYAHLNTVHVRWINGMIVLIYKEW